MNPTTGGAGHLQDGPTANRPTYRLIQVLRAIAALMVVVHHETIMLKDRNGLPLSNWVCGGSGVDIFFIISGFVMTISSAPLPGIAYPARVFLARRLERIVPMYWIMTTLKIVLLLLVPAVAFNALGSSWHVVASYLFLPARNAEGTFDPVLVVGWTLNFEMAFYVLFAITLAMRASLVKVLGPVLLAISLLSFWPGRGALGATSWYLSSMVFEFLLGILLALGVRQVRRIAPRIAWFMVALGLFLLCTWEYPNFSAQRGYLWGFCALAVVAGALALEQGLGPRAPRWLLELGDASYSIYLVHGFVLPVVGIVLHHFGSAWWGVIPISMAVMVVLSTAAGVLVYRLVELPIARWFKGRRKTAVPAVG